MRFLFRHWKISVPVTVAVLGVLAWLVFGFFAFHLVFVDDTIDEAAPVFASDGSAPPPPAPTDAPATAAAPTTAVPSTTQPRPAATAEVTRPEPAPATTAPPPTTAPPAPVVRTIAAGEFAPRDHATSGQALVLNDGSPQRFLRFQDFATENGPDLNVYLVVPDGDSFTEYVDLGDLKGNVGNQNYEIPVDVDLDRFTTVVIWCVRFSSPFGEATLA